MSRLPCIFPAMWARAGIFVSPRPSFVTYRTERPEEPPVSEELGKVRKGMAVNVFGTEFVLGQWQLGVLCD